MTRTLALLLAALFLSPLASASARETVRGSEASDNQVSWARKVGADAGLLLGGTRRVEITSFPKGAIVTGRGGETQLFDAEGNPALSVERIQFRTPEDAARFYEGAINELDGDGRWGMDLAGKWVVRATGPALKDPTLLNTVLGSAWKHGPKAGAREARILSVLDGKGYVFEDKGQNPTISTLFESYTNDARERSDRGQLAAGETLTDESYTSMSGGRHVSFTTKDGIRKGWIATEDMSVMMPSYVETFLTMKHRNGIQQALGGLLGGRNGD